VTETPGAVERYYTGQQLAERILKAAEEAGVSPITPAALAPADEFHTGGLRATRDLARLAGIGPGAHVLDIGSGIGGPARILASEFGCRVTGIDLTHEFVRSAAVLTERCGLADRVTFQEGNALNMPFADQTFDVAWTQHVVMNIEDRAGLYREARRVLEPGGILAFFDILRGNDGDLDYPLPWANEASINFLYTPHETRAFLKAAGFEEQLWIDASAEYRPVLEGQAVAQTSSPLNLRVVLGDEMPEKIRHVGAAGADGRLVYVQGIFRRP
jgi:ubiquinone/menaquinone biosynthesis C-methylase UbiE